MKNVPSLEVELTPSTCQQEIEDKSSMCPSTRGQLELSADKGSPVSGGGPPPPEAAREQLDDKGGALPSHIGVYGQTAAAREVGAALFNWLAAHFPCRLFADVERKRRLLPQLLLQVHPSPAVQLLLQQQLQLQQQQQQPQQQQQHQQQGLCPFLQQRLKHLAADCLTPSSHFTAPPTTTSSASSSSSSSSNDTNGSSSSSVAEGRCCLCEGLEGLHGVAWICSLEENAQKSQEASARCAIDDFACPFAFAVDAHGVCDIFPLPPQQQQQQEQQQPQEQQQQEHQQQEQQQQQQALEGFPELAALSESSPLRVCLKGGPPCALELLLQKLSNDVTEQRAGSPSTTGSLPYVTDAVLRELLFFLWGPPDACMAVDAAACDFSQWRLSVDLCSSCSKKRYPVYEQRVGEPAATSSSSNSSSSSSSSDRCGENDLSLSGVCATCTCCCLRCCCIRVPPLVLEAVARDGLRLPERANNNKGSSSKSREAPLERLLRVTKGGAISEPSSGDESWLSELPSSPSTASPPTSPRLLPPDASAPSSAAAEKETPAAGGHMSSASSLNGSGMQGKTKEGRGEPPQPPTSNAAAADAEAEAAAAKVAVAALHSSLSACLPRVGGRVTPLLNNSTLDDAGWIVGGARNVGSTQGASQLASSRSFLAFACTEPWEVLLLLHASAATTSALAAPLEGCADLLCGFSDKSESREVAVRPLASRRGVSRQLVRQPEEEQQAQQDQQQESTPLRLQLPLWLTLVETMELQKGREFRVFVAGRTPLGKSSMPASQLWLGECLPELVKSGSMRRRVKRSVCRFISQSRLACGLPPLFVADVYIHRNADETETCRLLMLHPWGSLTDPLLFSYEELRELLLRRLSCSEAAACEACCSSAQAGVAAEAQAAAAPKLRSCSCWERCELRYLRGSDAQVHDAQRALAMPQASGDLLEIAQGGGSSSHVEDLLMELKSAHLDVIKKQQKRK
ncbi:hypothetical protein Emed_001838 [Eimeria media]